MFPDCETYMPILNTYQILEGLVPVAFALIIWKILPDNPETASFLEKHEKEFIINRLALETGSGHGRVTNTDKVNWRQVRAAFNEWKVYAAAVVYWVCMRMTRQSLSG